VSQLVVGGKAVVVHVDDPRHPPGEWEVTPIEPATAAGPLTALLADPKAMAAALLDDPAVVVLGTELAERAVGPAAARKLLRKWTRLALAIAGAPHEVRTASWSYAVANVDWKGAARSSTCARACSRSTSAARGRWSPRTTRCRSTATTERPARAGAGPASRSSTATPRVHRRGGRKIAHGW
jgi:hypothetical protein